MPKLAVIVPYYNFTGNRLVSDCCSVAVAHLRQQFGSEHVFCMEASYDGNFDFEGQPNTRCFKVKSKIWYKENLINKAIKELPAEYTNVAWIDGDLTLDCTDIQQAVNAALADADFAQIGTHYEYLDASGQVEFTRRTAVYTNHTAQGTGSPGGAWAARRSTLTRIGYLPERAGILGGGDSLVTDSLLKRETSEILPVFKTKNTSFLGNILTYIRRLKAADLSVDYIEGRVRHNYHADHRLRQYRERYAAAETFENHQLTYDEAGLLQLNNPIMQAGIDEYMRIKNS